MANEKQVYRRAQAAGGTPPRRPRRQPPKAGRNMLAPLVALGALAVLICIAVVIYELSKTPAGPAEADFGTPAEAWQQNELGYYFNAEGEAIPAAVLKGIDVSKFQGEVDWEKAKAAGIDFAILRCGYGGEWDGEEADWAQDDPQWRRNADECTRLGIPFGVYLYSYATTEEEARSEADHVARLLGLVAPAYDGLDDYTASPYSLGYPVYYDLEDKYITGVFPDEMADLTAAFFDRLESYGYTGEQGLYASLNWVRARFSDPGFDEWRDHLWIARFSSELGYTGEYEMWQCSYTASGADYGVQSDTVDIDFIMQPFKLTGITEGVGKAVDPTYYNDTEQIEVHLDAKDARVRLTTNEADTKDGGRRVYWESSDESVATVQKDGTVRAQGDGQCVVTATLADGTESASCIVRVGDVTVPIFATGSLNGARAGESASLADIAAAKAAEPDSILLDAGGSLHGTLSASLTGGMDMMSAFSSAGYDLQAVGADDLAYGIERLQSDANVAAGPTLAANLRDGEGTGVFYRSTSWSRNRITNGMNYIVERAGYRIGFFALTDADTVNSVTAPVNEEVSANDLLQTAGEQTAALQAQGADAIVCIAASGTDAESLWPELKKLGVTAVIDGGTAAADGAGTDGILYAGNGFDALARLDLTFAPDGQVSASVSVQSAADLAAARDEREQQADSDGQASGDTAAETYASVQTALEALDTSDRSILSQTLFTFAPTDGAERTISFANYVAALYAELAANDTANLPDDAQELTQVALAGGVTEPAQGAVTRQALLDALPQAARIRLVRTTAENVEALIESGAVTQTYLEGLVSFDYAAGEEMLLVTDTATLAALDAESYTVLRDYGDVFWNVRMNINDLTNNFADDFTLPEVPTLGAGRSA